MANPRSFFSFLPVGLVLGSGALAISSAIAVAASPAPATTTADVIRATIPVAIDILPGEPRNIVDPAAPGAVAVAILGTAQFDARSIDPESLLLAGAAIVKNADGATHVLEDVNGDGRADLVVWFSPRELQLADADVFAVLQGRTRSGTGIEGRDAVQTLAAALRTAGRDSVLTLAAALRAADVGREGASDEKLPPLQAMIDASFTATAHSISVTILAGPDFDPRDILIGTLRINGSPLTRSPRGDLATLEDRDRDGLADLVVTVPTTALRSATALADHGRVLVTLSATTRTGRRVQGETSIATDDAAPADDTTTAHAPTLAPVPRASEPEPSPPHELGVDDAPSSTSTSVWQGTSHLSGRFTGGISIVDQAPSPNYPATISMSGLTGAVSKLRVTLNGIVHSCMNDLDIELVGPSGQSIVLMSDVGGCGPANATDITFDDFATGTLSSGSRPPTPITVRPYNQVLGDPFAAPAPPPSNVTALSAFTGTNPNGDWKLYVMDDAAGDTGSIRDGWTLDVVTTTTFCNTSSLTLPAGAPGSTSGPASVYPSSITVSGLPPQISKLSVTLDGLSHQSPDDLDVMLVAPSTNRFMLMSDSGGAGGATAITNDQLTFDDDAAVFLPDDTAIASSGTYRPTERSLGDVMPAPAPGGLYYTALNPLRGTNPNGTWQLYVADDAAGGTGALARGWCLNITAIAPSDMCIPSTMTVPEGAPGVTSGPASLYPATMYVTGTTGLIANAQVKLRGLTHTFPDDLDVVLESPSGKKLVLLSDAGGAPDVTNLDVTIDTAAAVSAPDVTALGPGPYLPTDYEPGETLPAGGPAPPYVTSLVGEAPGGNWKLWVADDSGGDWGSISNGWCLSMTTYEPYASYCVGGSDSLTIPNGSPGVTQGIAFPYPWAVYVPQEGTIAGKVQVRLDGLSHTFPDDLDVLLVGPKGQKVLLMSDAGGSSAISQRSLTFDDDAEFALPNSTLISTGTYRPSNYDGLDGDAFPASAPPGPYGSQLAAFRGTDPQGYWNMFVLDDAGGDVGVAGGWCLDIFPLFPVGEATNLRWLGSSKTTLTWDAAPNATGYQVLRGTPNFYTSLLTSDVDSCIAVSPSGQLAQGLAQLPAAGSLFWYLVVGTNGGPPGPAGRARQGSIEYARIPDSVASCNAP